MSITHWPGPPVILLLLLNFKHAIIIPIPPETSTRLTYTFAYESDRIHVYVDERSSFRTVVTFVFDGLSGTTVADLTVGLVISFLISD